MPVSQPGMRFGMPESEKFELHGDENQTAVLGDFGVMFSQGGQFLVRGFLSAKDRGDRIDSLPDPLFQQGEEDLLLPSKIGLKVAARIPGPASDVFQAGIFATITANASPGRDPEESP